MSRVDMIVARGGEPYVLELNTIPGFTETSDLPAQAKTAGISFDELVFEIHEEALDTVREKVIDIMEHADHLSVPIKVSVGVGKNWDEAH